MRTLLISLTFSPLLLLAQARTGQNLIDDGLKKYVIKSGKITYRITGDATGEEVMVFQMNGWQSMRKQTMVFELYGIKTIQTLHEITDGDYLYRLNEGDSTYQSRKDYKWSQQAAYKTPAQSSEAVLFSLGGTRAADSTLLDKKCEVWTFEGKALQELWVWNGLVLKRIAKLGDQMIYTTARNLEMGYEPEPSIFLIPSYMNEKE